MDYKEAVTRGNDILLTGIRHFDLAQTLDCGQAFRWAGDGNSYSGIAHGRRLEVENTSGGVVLKNITPAEFESTWKSYFDLGRDYTQLRESFSSDEHLSKAIDFSPGLRLMKQDVWEILISFILSQNSNIPRIKKMISSLCQHFGQELPCGGFAFPTAEKLADLSGNDLAPIKCGYRASYIIDAARRVHDGRFNAASLKSLPTDEVRTALLEIHGVGPKVADCVLLFGFGRIECYPLDVWMKRVMTNMYPGGFPESLKNHAGIAQQFLFHYARMSQALS